MLFLFCRVGCFGCGGGGGGGGTEKGRKVVGE